jgi:hypothetical protein
MLMHLLIKNPYKNKIFNFQIIFILTITILLISSTSIIPSLPIKTKNAGKINEHLIYGTATYEDGARTTSARVDVVSSFGTLTTWVNSDEYWEVNCGDPGPNWPIGMKFTVYITGCCRHSGWSGSASDEVRGTSNNMGNIVLYPNISPNTPSIPSGPIAIQIGTSGTYETNGTDPNGLNKIQYRFDWDSEGTHMFSQYTTYVNSGGFANKSFNWSNPGTYVVKAQTKDEHGAMSSWSDGLSVLVYESNNNPEPPIINGPSQGGEDVLYFFNISTTDADLHEIRYIIDWDDGNDSGWIGPYESGENVLISYSWVKRGTYNIRLKAKDIYESESEWSEPFSIKIVAPELSIGEINGNFLRINAIVKNIGDGVAADVNWNIVLNGGYFLSGENTHGRIDSIEPGNQIKVTSDLIFGLSGRTIIFVTANIEGQNEVYKEIESSIFLFLINVKT